MPFDANAALRRRLEKTGELDAVQDAAGEQIARYEELKAENKEVRGQWSVWVVEGAGTESPIARSLVGRDAEGNYVLLPNDAEHQHQEHVFATDREAEAAMEQLKQQFPEVRGAAEFRLMCGGIEEPPEPPKPFGVVGGGKSEG